MARLYDIDGEKLTFTQIRERVPPSVRTTTLRGRVYAYERRTWAALCEAPTHRPRPEDRVAPVVERVPHFYNPVRVPDVLDGLLGIR